MRGSVIDAVWLRAVLAHYPPPRVTEAVQEGDRIPYVCKETLLFLRRAITPLAYQIWQQELYIQLPSAILFIAEQHGGLPNQAQVLEDLFGVMPPA